MRVETKLYEAKVGSATYWVSALHPEHARELLYVVEEETGADAEEFEEAVIFECAVERAEKLRFNGSDGESRSMWGEFLTGRAPRVIACSEWP
jgi:hypothetical protein